MLHIRKVIQGHFQIVVTNREILGGWVQNMGGHPPPFCFGPPGWNTVNIWPKRLEKTSFLLNWQVKQVKRANFEQVFHCHPWKNIGLELHPLNFFAGAPSVDCTVYPQALFLIWRLLIQMHEVHEVLWSRLIVFTIEMQYFFVIYADANYAHLTYMKSVLASLPAKLRPLSFCSKWSQKSILRRPFWVNEIVHAGFWPSYGKAI